MLSSVLNSAQAVAVNIQIMRIFTKVRRVLTDTTELRLAIEELRKKTEKNTQNIEIVFQAFDQLLDRRENEQKREKIGFKTEHKEV